VSHETFWIADTHFGHEGPYTKFKRPDGSPLRPFSCAEEGDEAMIDRWNAVVGPTDRVYLLGDVAMSRRHVKTLSRLKGKIRLVKGNHDVFKYQDFAPYVDRIDGCVVRDGLIATHVPIHPSSMARFAGNLHGHLHANRVMKAVEGIDVLDERYLCVSVEHTDYRPISTEEVMQRFKDQGHVYSKLDVLALTSDLIAD
jgi:calcineurin-like phosphoesterase family protein